MVRQLQTMFYNHRYSETTLDRKTDFMLLAKAFGADGYRADSLPKLKSILQHLSVNGPSIIDCPINIDEKVLPMIPPGSSAKDIVTRG